MKCGHSIAEDWYFNGFPAQFGFYMVSKEIAGSVGDTGCKRSKSTVIIDHYRLRSAFNTASTSETSHM